MHVTVLECKSSHSGIEFIKLTVDIRCECFGSMTRIGLVPCWRKLHFLSLMGLEPVHRGIAATLLTTTPSCSQVNKDGRVIEVLDTYQVIFFCVPYLVLFFTNGL